MTRPRFDVAVDTRCRMDGGDHRGGLGPGARRMTGYAR
jgi:hypothetical protein